MGGLKAFAKACLGSMVAEYRINWIYGSPARPPELKPGRTVGLEPRLVAALKASPTPQVRKAADYTRSGLTGLAIVEDGRPLCVAHFAGFATYDRNSTWKIRPGEAALMDIVTEDAERGRGLAVELLGDSTVILYGQGVQRLIAFIWWSNTPSLRAFRKAGWQRIGFSIELRNGQSWRSLRLPLQFR